MELKCNIGVILAGGRGIRAGGNIPKQYRKVKGKRIIEYVFEAFENASAIDKIIVAAEECFFSEVENLGCICVPGGKERNDTIRSVLDYIKKYEPSCEYVLFHDSARPLVTSKYIDSCMELLKEYDAVITASHITDSLGKIQSGPIDRNDYYLIQTPEAFRFLMLDKYFKRESDCTAIVQQLPESAGVYRSYGLGKNLKMTYPEDFKYFEFITESEDK